MNDPGTSVTQPISNFLLSTVSHANRSFLLTKTLLKVDQTC